MSPPACHASGCSRGQPRSSGALAAVARRSDAESGARRLRGARSTAQPATLVSPCARSSSGCMCGAAGCGQGVQRAERVSRGEQSRSMLALSCARHGVCCGGQGKDAGDGGPHCGLIHGVADAEGRRYHGRRLSRRDHGRCASCGSLLFSVIRGAPTCASRWDRLRMRRRSGRASTSSSDPRRHDSRSRTTCRSPTSTGASERPVSATARAHPYPSPGSLPRFAQSSTRSPVGGSVGARRVRERPLRPPFAILPSSSTSRIRLASAAARRLGLWVRAVHRRCEPTRRSRLRMRRCSRMPDGRCRSPSRPRGCCR